MLKFYLNFFKQYKNALLLGDIMPLYPSTNYSAVLGFSGEQFVGAVYDNVVLPVDRMLSDNAIINSGFNEKVVISSESDLGAFNAKCYDPEGNVAWENTIEIKAGVTQLKIPVCGILFLKK